MKKYLVVLTITALFFMGCPTEDETTAEDGTTLKINNQSFTEITNVMWQNVPFSNNQYEKSIKSGTDVTNNVEAGTGYIFFKRKSNPITARTSELVVIEKNQTKEFTFIDNTIIVEINNPGNSGVLFLDHYRQQWFGLMMPKGKYNRIMRVGVSSDIILVKLIYWILPAIVTISIRQKMEINQSLLEEPTRQCCI